MQEIARRPYYQKTIQRRKQKRTTLNLTVISPDFGRINRQIVVQNFNALTAKSKLCHRLTVREQYLIRLDLR